MHSDLVSDFKWQLYERNIAGDSADEMSSFCR